MKLLFAQSSQIKQPLGMLVTPQSSANQPLLISPRSIRRERTCPAKPRFCQRQQEILAGIFKGTTKKQVIRRLRFITDDVVIVDIDNEIHGLTTTPSGGASDRRRGK